MCISSKETQTVLRFQSLPSKHLNANSNISQQALPKPTDLSRYPHSFYSPNCISHLCLFLYLQNFMTDKWDSVQLNNISLSYESTVSEPWNVPLITRITFSPSLCSVKPVMIDEQSFRLPVSDICHGSWSVSRGGEHWPLALTRLRL